MSLVDPAGRAIGSSAQSVLTVVLEGRTLNFGVNEEVLRKIPRDGKIKTAEILIKLLFPELRHQDLNWFPR